MAKFEVVSRFADAGLVVPSRGTAESAGYDLCVAEDIIIPPYEDCVKALAYASFVSCPPEEIESYWTTINLGGLDVQTAALTLDKLAALTKSTQIKPTLVSIGMKCKLDPDEFLGIVARSSTPLKYWIIVANAPGTVDADYYNNPDNEGEIFVQVINLSPFAIQLKKGDKIAQGIIQNYIITEDDVAGGARTGGFGSTSADYKRTYLGKWNIGDDVKCPPSISTDTYRKAERLFDDTTRS